MEYKIEYAPDAVEQLRDLTARQRSIVLDGVDEQLAHQPIIETRNRRKMRPNPIAPWELRLGALRVYYDVEEEPDPLVLILAIGAKVRNQVRIGGKVIDL